MSPARRLGGDAREDSHLEHPVGDDPRQADRPGEVAIEVDRVVVARGLGVRGDLLGCERDRALDSFHVRMMKSVRDRHSAEPSSAVVAIS